MDILCQCGHSEASHRDNKMEDGSYLRSFCQVDGCLCHFYKAKDGESEKKTTNPWKPRPSHKKRGITVSVTEDQNEAFELLKKDTFCKTDGEVIKLALSILHDITYGKGDE